MSELSDGAERGKMPRRTWMTALKPEQLKQCREAKRQTRSKNLNATKVAKNIVDKFSVCVSYRTVQRWLTDGKD